MSAKSSDNDRNDNEIIFGGLQFDSAFDFGNTIDSATSTNKDISKIEKRQNQFQEDLNSAKNELDDFRKNITREISNQKIQIIEATGIFVGLFTFVSVEFQMLRGVTDPTTFVVISLLLLGGLLYFFSLMHNFLGNKELDLFWKISFIGVPSAIVIVALLMFFAFTEEVTVDQSIEDNKKEIVNFDIINQ